MGTTKTWLWGMKMSNQRKYKVRLFYNEAITIGESGTTMNGKIDIRVVNGETTKELVRNNLKDCRKIIIEVKDE